MATRMSTGESPRGWPSMTPVPYALARGDSGILGDMDSPGAYAASSVASGTLDPHSGDSVSPSFALEEEGEGEDGLAMGWLPMPPSEGTFSPGSQTCSRASAMGEPQAAGDGWSPVRLFRSAPGSGPGQHATEGGEDEGPCSPGVVLTNSALKRHTLGAGASEQQRRRRYGPPSPQQYDAPPVQRYALRGSPASPLQRTSSAGVPAQRLAPPGRAGEAFEASLHGAAGASPSKVSPLGPSASAGLSQTRSFAVTPPRQASAQVRSLGLAFDFITVAIVECPCSLALSQTRPWFPMLLLKRAISNADL